MKIATVIGIDEVDNNAIIEEIANRPIGRFQFNRNEQSYTLRTKLHGKAKRRKGQPMQLAWEGYEITITLEEIAKLLAHQEWLAGMDTQLG